MNYRTLIADFDLFDEKIKKINNFLILLVSWADQKLQIYGTKVGPSYKKRRPCGLGRADPRNVGIDADLVSSIDPTW